MNIILEIIIISIIGTYLHFLYEISHHNKYVALFSAVNESTWEHTKIALTATFIVSIFDGLFLGMQPNFIPAKLISFLAIIILIPTIFYSYTAFTKKAILPIDISSFYITIAISQILFYNILNSNPLDYIYIYLSTIGIFILFGFYMVATLQPLNNFIFKDPITQKYGLKGHSDHH